MQINGWDIANANAKQWNVTPGFHAISNDSSWVRGSPTPNIFRNGIGFKPLKIVLLIRADRDRQEILQDCSTILAHLLEPAELVLDDFDHKFCGILAKHTLKENPLNLRQVKYNRAAQLTLEFNAYEYRDAKPVTATGEETVQVQCGGNILTPATIKITPQIGIATLMISGICRDPNTGDDLPVTVRELVTRQEIILDGETAMYTKGGAPAPKDIDIWEPPTLLPGNNRITLSSNRMDVEVTFHPRYM